MGNKRVGTDSNIQLCKRPKRYICGDDDRISRLPDDILIDILSFLSLGEAARTSVLSSRWMDLWKRIPYLNFDDGYSGLDKIPKKCDKKGKLIKTVRPQYLSWVNHIVRSHKALALNEFRIRFPLGIKSYKSITRWLVFAFSRHVQRLELDFPCHCNPLNFYLFPDDLLACSSSYCCYIHHHQPRVFVGVKSLRALIFRNLNVSSRPIEFLVHNCPLLEQLIISHSGTIWSLEVCGSSLKLKHLEIVYCLCLKSLKVSAPNLTYLKVTKLEGLFLENVPRLVEICAYCLADDISLRRLFSTLSRCVSQLEILHLVLVSRKEKNELCELPELPKLKKLVIEYRPRGRESLVRLSGLVNASPCLEELALNMTLRSMKDRKFAIMSPHHHLKVIKLSGYIVRSSDRQFVEYILKHCVVLQKLIIETLVTQDIVFDPFTREYAKQQLEGRVPQHIELMIL